LNIHIIRITVFYHLDIIHHESGKDDDHDPGEHIFKKGTLNKNIDEGCNNDTDKRNK
jgi:hypothetical protein